MPIQVIRETHRTPEAISEHLHRVGGSNTYGEPNYRIVWSMNRLSWIGGEWIDYDRSANHIRTVFELRRVPKYDILNRWILERWLPAQTYGSPAYWYATTTERMGGVSLPSLGPYPSRGEYEHSLTLETRDGKFVQLTPEAVDYIVRVIEHNRNLTALERKLNAQKQKERVQRARDCYVDAMLRDETPFIPGSWVTVPRDIKTL